MPGHPAAHVHPGDVGRPRAEAVEGEAVGGVWDPPPITKTSPSSTGRSSSSISGHDADSFAADRKARDALLWHLNVLGEVVRNVPEKIQATNPEMPCAKMRGMRNLLAHERFGINNGIIDQLLRGCINQDRSDAGHQLGDPSALNWAVHCPRTMRIAGAACVDLASGGGGQVTGAGRSAKQCAVTGTERGTS